MIPKPGNYFFLLPIIAFIPWWGMLIAMLACWAGQGHPVYHFMDPEQHTVYISDVGATNLNPLFISCAGWQGLFYVLTIACEFFQRSGYWPFKLRSNYRTAADEGHEFDPTYDSMKNEYSSMVLSSKFLMPPWYSVLERNLIFASFAAGLVGELGILFCSIFTTSKYPSVHTTMVSIFVGFMCVSIVCNIGEYLSMGKHYALLHPLAAQNQVEGLEKITYSDLKWFQWKGYIWNKFTMSGIAKVTWLFWAAVFAICFGAISDNSISAIFEWLLAFWFGIWFLILAFDFYAGSRYKQSRYFHQIRSFAGYYKYDRQNGSAQFSHIVDPVDDEMVVGDLDSRHYVPSEEYSR
ncbi:hypothetical protein ZYGR_0R00510 [Zygosaccharomyces rouxii]|uniref:ZYRO0F01210p n=2 Tax=Zygosaccharomyces rouxii TaxID=4956 RepID=C5DX06_ZYGRC|nr:uncharacterized protein ZYRO0F01210g [Zygosaccharomyces rouxii]KAH9199082.1 Frag1/DRAM/Sfk1 [Zygosaccharomyces rouxii]GAV49810.1 hypothetical protein ZYGR_0R00510 [Zygosaccharomyces rouxii]CAR28317.1 ZYRO0F01210p [Zygosaccharomyces rouxii]